MTEKTTGGIRAGVSPEAAELGLWLLSVRSFLAPNNHPGGGPETAAARDYRCETLVLGEVLLRCLHLCANVAAEGAPVGRAPEVGGVVETVGGPPSSPHGTNLARLAEGLKGALAFCEAAAASGSVGLDAWGHLAASLAGMFDDPEAARALTDAARAPQTGPTWERLAALAEGVAPAEFGEDLAGVFDGFGRLLGRLSFVERALASDAPLKSLLAVFALVNDEGRQVLDLVEQLSRSELAPPPVRQALDGAAYAFRIELRKTFEQELAGFCSIASPTQTFARAESACGLLRNNFQQSVVALAQSLDPAVEGRDLFDAFRTRLDESLVLREELWGLIRFAREVERRRSEDLVPVVAERLRAFHDWSLHYLMYKDREPFEKFLEEAESARGGDELGDVMHRLGAFLETLFGQVNMRATLADHPFNPDAVESRVTLRAP